MPDSEQAATHWVIDKRIPAALILAIAAQCFGLVAWGVNMSARVDQLETVVARLASEGTPAMRERVGRLEEKIEQDRLLLRDIHDDVAALRRARR